MKSKITKTAVDGLATPERGEIVLWDDTLAGFGVRVRPGGTRSYFVLYRAGHGRGAPMRKFVIGRHGSPWTAETARTEARRLLGQVANGADPAADKAEHRKGLTVAELSGRFLTEHVETRRKDRTAQEYRRLVEKVVIPTIGRKKVADVKRSDILRLHHDGREAPYQANRALAVLSKMFNLAEAWGLRPDGSNPCRHVERYAEKARERMLTTDEIGKLGDAMADYGSPFVPAAIKLLMFTGARLSEILTLQWDWIARDSGSVRLPDSKTGRKTLYLPAPAAAVLASLPRIGGNPYVIVGQKEGAYMVNLQKPWRTIRDRATVLTWKASDDPTVSGLVARLATVLERDPTIEECRAEAEKAKVTLPAGLRDVRLHDLRHSFASIAASRGDSLVVIGKLLGHSQAATTQRYAHLAADPLRASAGAVAAVIDAALADSRAEVMNLPRRKARTH